MSERSTAACCVAELVGTFILILFGCGVVHVAVTTGQVSGILQAALTWGLGVTLAIYVVGSVSGAHINPAITISMAVWGGFSWARVVPYIASQFVGAALAAVVLYICFADTIAAYEAANNIVRGEPASVITASMYGEYFPNPGVPLHQSKTGSLLVEANVPVYAAVLLEIICTAMLALCVFALTDPKNDGPAANMAPVLIGLTVAALIVVIGTQTQACLNPARDFGPRTVAYFAGWKDVAFPGPRGASATLLVYLVAPIVGAVIGGGVYAKVITRTRECTAGAS